MYIELNNIGAIKSGKFFVNGLSVIYGNNGTGKSTIAKVVMAMIKADNIARVKSKTDETFHSNRIRNFNKEIRHLFNFEKLSDNGNIKLKNSDGDKVIYDVTINNGMCKSFEGLKKEDKRELLDCTYMNTPMVWDWYNFFTVARDQWKYKKRRSEDIKYPYTLWDLYSKITNKRIDFEVDREIINKINYYMNGEIIRDRQDGKYYYISDNNDNDIVLTNTSSNIKILGIISTLLENCYMTPYGLFIFDEVEAKLDTIWQEKLVDILTDIVKSGVKVIVNTKSLYMIEIIEKISNEKEIEDKTNFYFADDENIGDIDNSLMKKW